MPEIVNNGYAYPSPATFVEAGCYIQKELNIEADLLVQLMPFHTDAGADMIVFQYSNIFTGVQQWRGLGNRLPLAPLEDVTRECAVLPGYWGEEAVLDEVDLTRRAVRLAPKGAETAVDITDLTMRRQKWLIVRRNNLIRKLISETLVFGMYEAINSQTGAVLQRQKYNINEVTPAIAWSDSLNSVPWIDLMNWRDYYEATTLSKFGSGAKIIMNRKTYSKLVKNTNVLNWRVLSGEYCCTQRTLEQINALLASHDLPQIVVYNESYFDSDLTRAPVMPNGGGVKRFFIPDDFAVIVGETDSATIGNYWFTRNVNTCSDVPMAGPVTMVVDECARPPRKISVLDYHNGGPALMCPKAIISAFVG